MTQKTSATPDYTMGFSEGMLQYLRRHTAENNSAFLLPHLRPGQRILDFGCGQGTISVGLAGAVAPGEMHGVDMEESQIELARSVARVVGQDNAIFRVADVTNLPFEDNYFDVAHCYNVLMHIPDTAAALSEIGRVLKPGGKIGSREMIISSCFTRPDFGIINKGWDMFGDLLAADDGHPDMGKDLKTSFVEAGFADILVGASFNVYSTPEDIEIFDKFVNSWFFSSEVTEAAIKYGAATSELCEEICRAQAEWKAHPGALVALAYGEAIAAKPLQSG